MERLVHVSTGLPVVNTFAAPTQALPLLCACIQLNGELVVPLCQHNSVLLFRYHRVRGCCCDAGAEPFRDVVGKKHGTLQLLGVPGTSIAGIFQLLVPNFGCCLSHHVLAAVGFVLPCGCHSTLTSCFDQMCQRSAVVCQVRYLQHTVVGLAHCIAKFHRGEFGSHPRSAPSLTMIHPPLHIRNRLLGETCLENSPVLLNGVRSFSVNEFCLNKFLDVYELCKSPKVLRFVHVAVQQVPGAPKQGGLRQHASNRIWTEFSVREHDLALQNRRLDLGERLKAPSLGIIALSNCSTVADRPDVVVAGHHTRSEQWPLLIVCATSGVHKQYPEPLSQRPSLFRKNPENGGEVATVWVLRESIIEPTHCCFQRGQCMLQCVAIIKEFLPQ
mmetsp:Transcript_25385/g.49932  ORF Transcript_25385/g.49932 Transcript_25385/m.49932 type:complete len:386 (-) Transcript_25385:442-1599(-)